MNEQMTLKELKAMMPVVPNGKTPKRSELKNKSEVVAEYQSHDFSLTVFDCGYVLAQHFGRWTIFPVNDCGGYEYEVADENPVKGKVQTDFDEEYFLDLPWTIRITLTAEDRLEHNAEIRNDNLIRKRPDYIRDYGWLQGYTPSFEYELAMKWEREEVMNMLTEKQREVMELTLEGYTQDEIGIILGINRNTVANRIFDARKKISKHFGKNQ